MNRTEGGSKWLACLLLALLLLPGVSAARAGPPPPELNIIIEPARDCAGGCWRLVSLDYVGEEKSGGFHHAFVRIRDEGGSQVAGVLWSIVWRRNGIATVMSKPAPEWSDIPLGECYNPSEGELGPYVAYVGGDYTHSDSVWGLGLPYCQLVSFYMTWQWDPGGPLPPRQWLPLVQSGS